MSSPLDSWDWEHYRQALRERASRLKRDPRVWVRFDESDLANETVLKTLKAKEIPEDLTDDQKRLRWLAVIQDHVLIDMYRKVTSGKDDVRREQALRQALQDSAIDLDEVVVDPSDSPSEKAAQRETEQLTDEAIAQLDSPQREILRLRQKGRTLQQIAKELGLTPPSVAGYYNRGLRKLKEQLGADEKP
jgi:RNA polymerase sigma-70 factor, ECF subfamily